MSDFLNDLDPNTLRNALRELTRRVGLLEAQMRPPLVPNGQMTMGDDGISVNDLGYGMTHETVYNTAYRLMRFGMFGAVTGNPAAATWDYYGDTGSNWLQMSEYTGWTFTTPSGTAWTTTGINPLLTITATANVATVAVPVINVNPGESYLLRLVVDVTTSSSTLAAKITYTWKDGSGTTIGSTADAAVISGATSGPYTAYTVAVAPAGAATLTCVIYGSSTSGSASGTITYWFDTTLADYCRIRKVTDLWKSNSAISGWWTKSVAVTNNGVGSWPTDTNASAQTSVGGLDSVTDTESSLYLAINPNITYQYKCSITLSGTGSPTSRSATSSIDWYDKNRKLIQSDTLITVTTLTTTDYNQVLTIPAGAFYARLKRRLYVTSNSAASSTTAAFGTVATTELFSEQLYMQQFFDDRPIMFDGFGAIDLGMPYIHLQDQKANNTAGGTFTAGAWQTRTLNTIVTDTHNLTTLASNQFWLPAGVYRSMIRAPGYRVDAHQIRLQDVTNSITIGYGSNEWSTNNNASLASTDSKFMQRFVVSSGALFEVQHYCATTYASNGFGVPNNFGNIQIYAEVMLWKEQ